MDDLFGDLVVVELASVLAGPLAGSFFAELGAKVTKIENKRAGGDVTRQWKLPCEDVDSPISAYYASANTGKKVLQLDLADEADYQLLMAEIAQADVVISNYQRRTAEKLRIDHVTIHSACPSVVFAQLSAYSYDDPRPGYDLVMQAEAGYISMNGSSNGALAKMPVAMIDIIAGHQLKEAVLIGLIQRMKTGKGSYVEVSLYKSAISALANQASNFLMYDHVPQPMGTLHPNIAPYGDIVKTKDDILVLLAVGSDAQFAKLVKTLTLELSDRNTFNVNKDRVERREGLVHWLQVKIKDLNYEELSTRLTRENVPFCKVADLRAVFADPIAIEMTIHETLEGVDTSKVRNVAFEYAQID